MRLNDVTAAQVSQRTGINVAYCQAFLTAVDKLMPNAVVDYADFGDGFRAARNSTILNDPLIPPFDYQIEREPSYVAVLVSAGAGRLIIRESAANRAALRGLGMYDHVISIKDLESEMRRLSSGNVARERRGLIKRRWR